jgi:hypothetical protein
MSLIHTGRKWSDEQKQKLSDAPTGISRSEMVESLASIIDKFILR